ncbi:CopG family antitoxin [Marispirochaeta aestuarii]|uniref:CopG family antitoxin n=1 Tax=Marispirochaeta aestuarii TaxID=1963862 RepID=UPI0029C997DD|nr:CopG family antitoxin [Marispirochaeta aestuarii]
MNDKHFEPLDSEEKELMESIENDEFVSIRENREKKISDAMQRANATLKKDKRMNIRISERDLKNLKIRALEEGIPYQTLVSMVLHKYLSGKLKETA